MGANKELMFRMQEQEYFEIPYEIREKHFSSKNMTPKLSDFNELMKDAEYKKLYKESKLAKERLLNQATKLREEKRKLNK